MIIINFHTMVHLKSDKSATLYTHANNEQLKHSVHGDSVCVYLMADGSDLPDLTEAFERWLRYCF